ncbi:MAG TPA: SIMPL domain-containing protein [Pseudonocardiaceae bacterium]
MAELVTTGTGEAERIADRAELRLSWVGRGRDRTVAVDELAARIKAVEPQFDRAGVEVRSRRLSVHDTWRGKRRDGAQATQSYLVRIADVTVLDDLLAGLVGTEPDVIDGPTWSLADDTGPSREARFAAVADARAKADGYAEAFGGRIGALKQVTDSSQPHIRPMAYAVAMRSHGGPDAANVADLALEPQQVTVSAQCTVTWELDA